MEHLVDEAERWLPVVGYEGRYEVSDLGRVRSLDRVIEDSVGHVYQVKGRIRKQTLTGPRGKQYMAVSLWSLGKEKCARVHLLVLEAFRGRRPIGHEGCHNDGKRSNNALPNLRWDTPKSNNADKISHGTTNRGSKHGLSKLNEGSIERIRDLRRFGCIQQDIGNWFQVKQTCISKVLRGLRWQHLEVST